MAAKAIGGGCIGGCMVAIGHGECRGSECRPQVTCLEAMVINVTVGTGEEEIELLF